MMDLTIERLLPNDLAKFKELILVFEDVFEMENLKLPHENHLQRLLNKDTFFAVVAKINDKVIGGLTIYVLDQYYSEKPLAYIYDLAVLTTHQRKGVGNQLIKFTNNFCTQNGFEEVFVQADKVDDYAIDFYRSTQPTNEEQVVHFYYKFTNES